MKYQFDIQNGRVKFLISELRDRINIVRQDDKWTRVEITIESNMDLLHLFHAGCKTGVDAMMSPEEKV